ncbi:M4 family metallopeptidase [Streptomyces sp. NPDC058892]|uniref:M4 family metallopeptidase n=1 Tax=unclassified Streptomyces TaxID=2593676 RepID=UPI0036CD3123
MHKRRRSTARRVRTGAALAAGLLVAAGLQLAASASEPDLDRNVADAEADVARHPKAFGYGPGQSLRFTDAVVDADGTRHIRFERTYQGLPVIGGDLVVHQDRNGRMTRASRAKGHSPVVRSLEPVVTVSEAAAAAHGAATGIREAVAEPRLVVWAVEGTARLAWQTTVRGVGAHDQPTGLVVVTDAATGERIESYTSEHQARGEGRSAYAGKVPLDTSPHRGGFSLTDPVRGHVTKDAGNIRPGRVNAASGTLFTDADNRWGDGRTLSRDRSTAAVDAHANTALTHDYFKKTFGRKGIRNDGRAPTVFVHVGKHWDNAQWDDSCFCMLTGDGDGRKDTEQVDLDTMGHEMTHGITAATARLRYHGEAGGLNEATSDIFGTMVEWYADNRDDTPDYLFSDRSTPPWLRRLDQPSRDGRSPDCWSPKVRRMDPHQSSGVGNHWFYLASEGSGRKTVNGTAYNSPTCDGSQVTGIGNEKAAKIWYRALTVYMTSTTDYHEARGATLDAARDLYGKGSKEYRTVAQAWGAVNVG